MYAVTLFLSATFSPHIVTVAVHPSRFTIFYCINKVREILILYSYTFAFFMQKALKKL